MSRFYFMTAAIGFVMTFFYWLMYRTGVPFFRHGYSLVILALPLVFGWVQFRGPESGLPLPVLRFLSYLGGYWLAFFHYSLYFFALYLVLRLGLLLAGAVHPGLAGGQTLAAWYARAAFVIVLAIVVGGGWNALHPRVRTLTYDTGGRLPSPQKVVFVTDIHLGGLFGRSYAEELVRKVNAQKPDLVLLGGDLIDNKLIWILREKSYEPLAGFRSTYGTYAVRGNHDHYDGRVAAEQRLFESTGIRFLVNGAVDLPDRIRLVGLEDYRTMPVNPYLASLAGRDPQQVRILMEHQPRRFLEARDAGYDLYLCGHTHAGQQAPLNFITGRMYLLDYGARRFGSMLGVVSSGYGLWGSPVRVGNRPEIVVLDLR